MKTKVKDWLNYSIAVIVLFALCGCQLDFGNNIDSYSKNTVKSAVSRCIDEELSTILPYLDEDTQITISSGSLTGSEIVSRAAQEDNGEDYIDFCYAVQKTAATQNTDYLLDSAKNLLPSDKYNEVERQIADAEHHLGDMTRALARTLPADEQEAFYSDLRSLVIKTSVLLVAGIVYAIIPDAVIWGKVTAAAALAVGAGVVSGVVMDLYGHYKRGYTLHTNIEQIVTDEKSFSSWLLEFKEEPEAYFALATSIISLSSSLELNPVATGIILVVFAAFNVWSTIQTMKDTYNFDA